MLSLSISSDFLNSMANENTYPHVPPFAGKTSSSAIYDEEAISRDQISTIEPNKRAANLLLHMPEIARGMHDRWRRLYC